MEPVRKLKLDSDEVIMTDDTARDLNSLMSKIKQHSNISNTEDNNDVSRNQRIFNKNIDNLEYSPGSDCS